MLLHSRCQQGRALRNDHTRCRKDNKRERRVRFLTLFPQAMLNTQYRMVVNNDIDVIILRGEERTAELNSKYEGLNLEDLNNFKSDASVQQWEGEDFRAVRYYCPALPFLAETSVSEKIAELQSAFIVEAGTKIQLFRR